MCWPLYVLSWPLYALTWPLSGDDDVGRGQGERVIGGIAAPASPVSDDQLHVDQLGDRFLQAAAGEAGERDHAIERWVACAGELVGVMGECHQHGSMR